MMSEGEQVSSSFRELKGYCLQLLQVLPAGNPNHKATASTLSRLHHFLRHSPPHALQPFFDYTLFPLLLLLDAAVDCRSPSNEQLEGRPAMTSAVDKPHNVTDVVAEGVLQCLEELLNKCHLVSVDQMVVLLRKLTRGALLSPSEAAEEFRGGVVRCFRALLVGLRLCTSGSCACKQINGLPALVDQKYSESSPTPFPKYKDEPGECLLAFLRSQSASAAVGHWLSLLLKIADNEATRGHRGSAQLRVEAFMALRVLVAKVGTADALAFFLPGVVSQIGKVLHVSKTMISGAAGSMEAMNQAIRGLAEFLMMVLQDDANVSILDIYIDDNRGHLNMGKSTLAFLEELRHLPGKKGDEGQIVVKDSIRDVVDNNVLQSEIKRFGSTKSDVPGTLCVNRTEDWMASTSAHVDKLLSATFPYLCVHPSNRVRRGILAATQGLLSKCSYTLKGSRIMLMECLCALVCDDDEEVSVAAQVFLEYLFSSSEKHHVKHDVADIFNRLIEKLPEVVIGGEETLAVSHAQKLLALIYFSGPQLVKDRVLHSPVTAARFFDIFALCLSQNSLFSGSLEKLLLERPSSIGYVRSITEMKATALFTNEKKVFVDSNASEDTNYCERENEYDLPRMPPWFASFGRQKLYQPLAEILRLVSLALIADSRTEGSLSIIKDIPLSYFRRLVDEVRKKEYTKESWESWYSRTNSGKLVREASTAACILNEMLFGLSGQVVDKLKRRFHKSSSSRGRTEKLYPVCDNKIEADGTDLSAWNVSPEVDLKSQLVDCIGTILHEYLSPEVWNLPLEPESSHQQWHIGAGDIALHSFHDNAMLHQVIIDGVGIFNLCLERDFLSSGFLHLSLYVLLENVISPNFQIRRASDVVLHVISATSGYPTVGHLVLANSDYVIDSVCRQLRHLDLNPHVPSVLAAILSYIGVAHKILPLMEEPMRSVSQELEILGRHQHPELTISFLMAVAEIAKASNREAFLLPSQAESYCMHVKSELSKLECATRNESDAVTCPCDGDKPAEQCEAILFRLSETKSYRRTVGSISSSCITAATPLLASVKQEACLVALGVIEDGIASLAKLEESYRQEVETRKVLRQALELYLLHNLGDTLDADEDGNEENRLLPAMNKIWPFLIACIRNRNPLTARRCASVISRAVQICGGDFFSRRFHTDGPHFWKLLSASPFQKKSLISKGERTPLQLPYRSSLRSTEDHPSSEISDLKVQEAVLKMIADISRNKRSASALECVLKKVSGLVVGIACSGVGGLRDASINALTGLWSMDPDLIWLLLADIYYSNNRETPLPPATELPQLFQVLPPPPSSKSYLYVQYGGQSYGFNIDFSSVEIVFKKIFSQAIDVRSI